MLGEEVAFMVRRIARLASRGREAAGSGLSGILDRRARH